MIKKNLLTIIILLLILLVLSTILSIIGYKAFCTLDQNVDWNAVTAISEISMAFFTVIAIFIAIYIPQKDRITSSKIELFTQRFEIYSFIINIFEKAFEEGKTAFNDEILYTLGLKTEFLIDKQDDIKLTEILKSINDKISLKFKDKSNPDLNISIDEETKAIYKLFDKYLDLRAFGVQQRDQME